MPRIVVSSSPHYGYCDRWKDLLTGRGLPFEDLDVSVDRHREELARRLPRARSIPQIFIDGEHIGAYEDLCILDEVGKLAALTA